MANELYCKPDNKEMTLALDNKNEHYKRTGIYLIGKWGEKKQ